MASELCPVKALVTQGRRECRVQAAPMARLQQGKQAAVTTGTPKHAGIPCAMVLRLIAGSPRRPGFDCLRRLPITACRAREGPTSPIDRLDPSIGGPGPHAFAVREECFRPRVKRAEHPHVHRLPLPTSVTIAIRPSCGGGMRADNHVFPKNGRGIFYAKGVDICSDYTK